MFSLGRGLWAGGPIRKAAGEPGPGSGFLLLGVWVLPSLSPVSPNPAPHARPPGLTPYVLPPVSPGPRSLSQATPGSWGLAGSSRQPPSRASQSPRATAQGPQSSFPHGSGHPEGPMLSPRHGPSPAHGPPSLPRCVGGDLS